MTSGKAIFITGTGTQVGKSMATSLLAQHLITKGQSVITQKWVQSGGSATEDLETHWKWINDSKNPYPDLMAWMAPYTFKTAAAPHLAAQLEEISIDESHLMATTYHLQTQFDTVLIEGSGGLMVPISHTLTWLDILKTHRIPTIIVTENTLGCINHTLLTVQALQTADIPIIGIIYNHLPTTPNNPLIQEDNIAFIQQKTKLPTLAIIPANATPDQVRWHFEGPYPKSD